MQACAVGDSDGGGFRTGFIGDGEREGAAVSRAQAGPQRCEGGAGLDPGGISPCGPEAGGSSPCGMPAMGEAARTGGAAPPPASGLGPGPGCGPSPGAGAGPAAGLLDGDGESDGAAGTGAQAGGDRTQLGVGSICDSGSRGSKARGSIFRGSNDRG